MAGQLDDAIIVALVLRHFIRAGGEPMMRELWPGPERSLALILRLARTGGSQPEPDARLNTSRSWRFHPFLPRPPFRPAATVSSLPLWTEQSPLLSVKVLRHGSPSFRVPVQRGFSMGLVTTRP
jgi:hypothetical protein